VTTVLVLRMMSRRFREGGGRSGEADVPYGPSEPIAAGDAGASEDERTAVH